MLESNLGSLINFVSIGLIKVRFVGLRNKKRKKTAMFYRLQMELGRKVASVSCLKPS